MLFGLLARLRVEDELSYRYPAVVAGVGVFVGRWVWFGCRVIHGGLLSRLSGLRGASNTAGASSLSDTRILLQFFAFVYSLEAKILCVSTGLVVSSA